MQLALVLVGRQTRTECARYGARSYRILNFYLPFTNSDKKATLHHGFVALLSPIQFKGLRTIRGYPEQLHSLGDHLLARRLKLSLRQRDIADRLGVTPYTILNWEKNRTCPGFREMPAVLRFLGYDPFPAAQTLDERLLRYRWTHGLSQRKMAELLHLDPCTLSKLERSRPTYRSVRKHVEAFLKKGH